MSEDAAWERALGPDYNKIWKRVGDALRPFSGKNVTPPVLASMRARLRDAMPDGLVFTSPTRDEEEAFANDEPELLGRFGHAVAVFGGCEFLLGFIDRKPLP